jgi:hypothetical protein
MADCFCGCGRKVGLTTRGMNKQGRRTVELLDKLRAAREKLEREGPAVEGGDSGPLIARLGEMIEEGEEYEGFWTYAVHGGELPPPSEVRPFKRAWVEWGKRGMRFTRLLSLPPEELARVIRSAGDD